LRRFKDTDIEGRLSQEDHHQRERKRTDDLELQGLVFTHRFSESRALVLLPVEVLDGLIVEETVCVDATSNLANC